MHTAPPIEVLPLFARLDKLLLQLLRQLSAEQWSMQTIAKQWTVKDVAAHLLDGNIRTVSMLRDKHMGEKPGDVAEYTSLVAYLNTLNADWVKAFRRVSPQVIIAMLESTAQPYIEALQSLHPWEDAVFSVAWAGEETSKNWFHIAREYSEKWIHQQQIRDAVGDDALLASELFYPAMDVFMCGLPHNLSRVEATTGTSVMVRIPGAPQGEWHVNKTDLGWVLRKQTEVMPITQVTLDKDTAWKLFSKAITPAEAKTKATIVGDEVLANAIMGMVSVMA